MSYPKIIRVCYDDLYILIECARKMQAILLANKMRKEHKELIEVIHRIEESMKHRGDTYD